MEIMSHNILSQKAIKVLSKINRSLLSNMDTATITAITNKLLNTLVKPVLLYMHAKFGDWNYHHTKLHPTRTGVSNKGF